MEKNIYEYQSSQPNNNNNNSKKLPKELQELDDIRSYVIQKQIDLNDQIDVLKRKIKMSQELENMILNVMARVEGLSTIPVPTIDFKTIQRNLE